MQLARLDLSCAELEMLPVLISEEDRPLVVRVSDADTVTALAGVAGDWEGSWGVWLEPGEDYGIGALARDVRTLAQLIELDHVVLDHAHAEHYAVALDALLRGEEVSVENETLVLRAVVSRPVVGYRVTVWHVEGESLVHAERRLRRGPTRGPLTYYLD